MERKRFPKIIAWALYDLSNQFFALNMVSLYFPLWITKEKQAPDILYGVSFAISMIFVSILAPLLGTVADITKRHKDFLIYTTLISIIFTMMLGITRNIFLALTVFAIANFGCQTAVVFYNSLIVTVSPKNKIGLVSGIGRMCGYIGAVLALVFTKPVIVSLGYQATFFITGCLFLIFSLPCLIFIKYAPKHAASGARFAITKKELKNIFQRWKKLFSDSAKFSDFHNFLKGSFFGLCVINTVILFMSVYATKAIGLTEIQIIHLMLFSTIFAVIGSLSSGIISDRIGYKKTYVGIFALWSICILFGTFIKPPFHWALGALTGLTLGGSWVISRALAVKLAPEQMVGEVFGFFSLVSNISSIVGPILWGLGLLIVSSLGGLGYRIIFFGLIVLIVIGIVFLSRIKDKI